MNSNLLDSCFKGKDILITGGLGFIGANLARRLVAIGARVVLVDSLIPSYGGNVFNVEDIKNLVNVNISDVRDQYSFRYLVQNKDYLFNLAGQTSHMDSMADPFTDLEINSRAQLAILETCRSFNQNIKIVFASTRQIYGRPDYLPVDEKHLLRPVDVNGVNKIAGEFYHMLYNNVYGIPTCALRLTNTYGPCMRIKDARQTFVGIWIRLLLEDKPFDVWGGTQLRDFTYVDDVVEALLTVATCEEANGQVYNLGGDAVVSLKEIADLLIEVNGGGTYRINPFPADRKPIDIGDYYASFDKIRAELGWEPRIGLREGLSKTLEYFRINLRHYL